MVGESAEGKEEEFGGEGDSRKRSGLRIGCRMRKEERRMEKPEEWVMPIFCVGVDKVESRRYI